MKTVSAIGIIFLAIAANVSRSCRLETDGCSTPVKNVPFVEVFTPACDRHDICYRCVSIFPALAYTLTDLHGFPCHFHI